MIEILQVPGFFSPLNLYMDACLSVGVVGLVWVCEFGIGLGVFLLLVASPHAPRGSSYILVGVYRTSCLYSQNQIWSDPLDRIW